MASLADAIEAYLLQRLEQANGLLEIQRGELSEMFGCAPSQINYVLHTRFTHMRGFLVESKRGGAGYIRIVRVAFPSSGKVLEILNEKVGDRIGQERAEGILSALAAAGVITVREAAMIRAAVDRRTLSLPLPERDEVRARLLKAMLVASLCAGGQNGAAAGSDL